MHAESTAFGHEAAFSDAGRQLGLDQWAFYFGARAGVLGPVDAEVVMAVCGFFSPSLVHPAWESALAAASPAELVAAAGRCTGALAGMPYGCLDRTERAGLVALLRSAHQQTVGWPVAAVFCRDEVRRDATTHANRTRPGGRPAPRGEPMAAGTRFACAFAGSGLTLNADRDRHPADGRALTRYALSSGREWPASSRRVTG
jgi:hypothetical protein